MSGTVDPPSPCVAVCLYDHERGEVVRVGRFFSLPDTCSTAFRTDLHPRFDHAGTRVCIDSTHEDGERHLYVIDVSSVVGEPSGSR